MPQNKSNLPYVAAGEFVNVLLMCIAVTIFIA